MNLSKFLSGLIFGFVVNAFVRQNFVDLSFISEEFLSPDVGRQNALDSWSVVSVSFLVDIKD